MPNERYRVSRDDDHGLAIDEARPRLKRPPLYRVILRNDDYTPMEFVVQVLEKVFSLDRNTATRIMLEAHLRGVALVTTCPLELAELYRDRLESCGLTATIEKA